jgi:hypothetical protein
MKLCCPISSLAQIQTNVFKSHHAGLRKATVETADDCEFLTIDIASYQSSMEEITAQRNEAKAAFFSRLPLFEQFSDEELLHLSKYFYTTTFRPGLLEPMTRLSNVPLKFA